MKYNAQIYDQPSEFLPQRWLPDSDNSNITTTAETNTTATTAITTHTAITTTTANTNNSRTNTTTASNSPINTSTRLAAMESNLLTFGYGARMCPGMYLSNIEATILIANIVHNYDLSLACPTNEITRHAALTINPNKLPIIFTKRR